MKPNFTIIGLGVIAAVLLSGCQREVAPGESTTAQSSGASHAPFAVAPTNQIYGTLKGRWERPDGGYVLEIRGADAAGSLEAGCFNPSPIDVSQARACQAGGVTKVFVELRDENYPGCTYKLAHDA